MNQKEYNTAACKYLADIHKQKEMLENTIDHLRKSEEIYQGDAKKDVVFEYFCKEAKFIDHLIGEVRKIESDIAKIQISNMPKEFIETYNEI